MASGSPRRRFPGRPATILICSVILALVTSAGIGPGARSAFAQDRGVDPAALPRLDPDARDLPVKVIFHSDGTARDIEGRMLLAGSEEIYLPSATVASLFMANRLWQDSIRQLTLRLRGHTIQLTAGSRLVRCDDNESLLPTPILDIDGDLWLPVELLVRLLGPTVGESVLWERVERTLRLGSARFNVTSSSIETLTRATAVHLYCEDALSYRAEASEPGTVILKVYGGEVNGPAVAKSSPLGLVQGISSRQFEDHVKIYVKVDDLVGQYRTYTRQHGREIVLVLEEERIASLPDPTPRGRVSLSLEPALMDVTRSIDVRRVVIDPGHGGLETGARGRKGTLEKDINLAVAQALKRYLERESNLEVVLTRTSDRQVGLADRAELANEVGGDLFVSLHCNNWFSQGAQGIETYFLSPAKTDWARSVEAAENQGLATGEKLDDDVSFIVWELVQNKFISSSSDLAEIVQRSLCDELSGQDRGVKQAGFRVLVGAYMPAVLVEMGFLSHPDDEQKLRDGSYQQRLARALGLAILEFKERYGYTAHLARERGN